MGSRLHYRWLLNSSYTLSASQMFETIMNIPAEVIELVRHIFRQANIAATKMISESPNVWEETLDMALITQLNYYDKPIQATHECLLKLETHFLGGRKIFHNWEIADIGIIVLFRIRGKLVRTKLVMLQSKRLYPNEISEPKELEQYHYLAGFSRLYRENEDYAADINPRVYTWSWNSKYRAIKSQDDQENAIRDYEQQTRIPVYYLLYNPYKMAWKMSVPTYKPLGSGNISLGVRVLPSSDIRAACAGLSKDAAPSAERISAVRMGISRGYNRLGKRFEDFIADRILGCHEGYITQDPEDRGLARVFFRRNAPISAAIAITIDVDK